MENSSFFEPWVGENFHTGGIFGKKLLILGESLYCSDCADCGVGKAHKKPYDCWTTTKSIDKILNDFENTGMYKRTFTKFEKAIYGNSVDKDIRNDLWNSVLYYNFVQISLNESRKSPTSQNFRNSDKAFFEILEQYRPDGIIAWGRRLWKNLPGGILWEELDKIEIDGESERCGAYTLQNGDKVKVMSIVHPSWGFTPENWHPFIKLFIQKL
ncbi:MAG: hypothetical protein QMB99_05555 [Paludibacteraceae bacterium]